ncbi:MAG: hypothetical protein V2J55_19540 [Candidatus Competibacteraceae bacterium]|nr:hypothetical protein [Candidatus Competibacteraceae bacterium]
MRCQTEVAGVGDDDFPATAARGKPQLNEIGEAIILAAKYLTRSIDAEGRFVYRINPKYIDSTKTDYNVLRHAGTIYALASYYRQWHAAVPTRSALLRAGQFLQICCMGAITTHHDLLGIWSPPTVTGADRLQLKLGGNGLGLVALLNLEAIQPGFTSKEEFLRLGRFIIYMQKPDGSFFSKYIPSQGGRQDRWVSLYYPGEAALGLLLLYDYDPAPIWLHSAAKALAHLAHSRASQASVPADHWALLATAHLLQGDRLNKTLYATWHKVHQVNLRELLIGHVVQISQSILNEQLRQANDPLLLGGFTPDGRTAPTATRLEGLLAALEVLPTDCVELRQHIEASVHTGMAFLLRAQIRSGQYAGALPRAVLPIAIEEAAEAKRFNQRVSEIRIDYVQHALSAMLQYVRYFGAESSLDQ